MASGEVVSKDEEICQGMRDKSSIFFKTFARSPVLVNGPCHMIRHIDSPGIGVFVPVAGYAPAQHGHKLAPRKIRVLKRAFEIRKSKAGKFGIIGIAGARHCKSIAGLLNKCKNTLMYGHGRIPC